MANYESLINQQINQYRAGLLVVDENLNPALINSCDGWHALTNRFDQHNDLLSRGWSCTFSDFVWPGSFKAEVLVCRISKEKAVVNHILNLAAEQLKPGSKVILLGDKSEGIKSYAKNGQKRLGGIREEEKIGGDSWKIELSVGSVIGEPLDDQKYPELREIENVGKYTLYSKPGVYGWKKIDQGSQQLIERLPQMLEATLPLGDIRILDLGCGSGYLTVVSCGPKTQGVATDNNAAALIATRQTIEQADLNIETIVSNAGEELESGFDLILCNPPFHSGFGIDYDLTDRFSKQAARLLTNDGIACFVVNQHVPLKRIASAYFHVVELDLDSYNFCTYKLQKPKR